MKFTTVMQVPSSKNSRLLKELARIEPRVAKTSGYQAKLVEKSGRQLSKMFIKDLGAIKCPRLDCIPCKNSSVKGTSMCRTKSVVYESVCALCETQHLFDPKSQHRGKYIGQTSRTLYECAIEHVRSLRNYESDSFSLKHWSIHHKDLERPPRFDFKVLRCHSDPLSRMIHKSVKIARLKVEKTDKETLKDIERSDSLSKWEQSQVNEVGSRSKGLGLFESSKNNSFNCRKRRMTYPQDEALPTSLKVDEMNHSQKPLQKKPCFETLHGVWDSNNAAKKPKKSMKMKSVKSWLEKCESKQDENVKCMNDDVNEKCELEAQKHVKNNLHRLESHERSTNIESVKSVSFEDKKREEAPCKTTDVEIHSNNSRKSGENEKCELSVRKSENSSLHRLEIVEGPSKCEIQKCEISVISRGSEEVD